MSLNAVYEHRGAGRYRKASDETTNPVAMTTLHFIVLLCLLRIARAHLDFVTLHDPLGVSVLGDPGMKSENVRVAVEGWNFCNRVGVEPFGSASPRWADCTDAQCSSNGTKSKNCSATYKVSNADNDLRTSDAFPSGSFESSKEADVYVVEKEKYLASLCEENSTTQPWHFWMIMLKNGNLDVKSGLCKSFATRPMKLTTSTNRKTAFPCFGPGCMNQPLVHHSWSTFAQTRTTKIENAPLSSQSSLSGSFYGTYDLDATGLGPTAAGRNMSFFSVAWEKNASSGSWVFKHKLTVSPKYPWLMLYLRADATSGVSGGYPWETRGMMRQVPVSPNFKVVVTLDVIQGGGPNSQFYLIDIGGCWKNDGNPCDGNVDSDVTRYVEMIINPQTANWCRPDKLSSCPPWHMSVNGTMINRIDKENFPYSAYHLYCSPPNAKFAVEPRSVCDPYSNPQAQELVQLLPHPEWAVHGYPKKKGDGWIGDSRTWFLDVGALSDRLYFYQDPGTQPATRGWPSIDVGTEIFISHKSITAEWTDPDTEPATRVWPSVDVGTEVYVSKRPHTAEWTVSDFDVLIPAVDMEETLLQSM